MISWYVKIVDRGPFFNNEHGKEPPLPQVRDVYLICQHGDTGHEGVMWGIERSLAQVTELYRWAVSLGIRVVYDYGTENEKHRRPTGIPELDGTPLPTKASKRAAKPSVF